MTDKELGELWARLTLNHPNPLSADRKVEALIRKLVEERRQIWIYRSYGDEDALRFALSDFGIDWETMK
jgi:hypothetical protein